MPQARQPGQNPRLLKTKEVLEATGITHQVLYRYVTMGLIEELATQESGHRLFPPETVAAVKLIQRLNLSGYTLRDIKDIFFKSRHGFKGGVGVRAGGAAPPRSARARTRSKKA
jgi:DNA-binding transcriptional MerR regulator